MNFSFTIKPMLMGLKFENKLSLYARAKLYFSIFLCKLFSHLFAVSSKFISDISAITHIYCWWWRYNKTFFKWKMPFPCKKLLSSEDSITNFYMCNVHINDIKVTKSVQVFYMHGQNCILAFSSANCYITFVSCLIKIHIWYFCYQT